MSPDGSEDLTETSAETPDGFVLLRSPDTAEHDPDYEIIATFPVRPV